MVFFLNKVVSSLDDVVVFIECVPEPSMSDETRRLREFFDPLISRYAEFGFDDLASHREYRDGLESNFVVIEDSYLLEFVEVSALLRQETVDYEGAFTQTYRLILDERFNSYQTLDLVIVIGALFNFLVLDAVEKKDSFLQFFCTTATDLFAECLPVLLQVLENPSDMKDDAAKEDIHLALSLILGLFVRQDRETDPDDIYNSCCIILENVIDKKVSPLYSELISYGMFLGLLRSGVFDGTDSIQFFFQEIIENFEYLPPGERVIFCDVLDRLAVYLKLRVVSIGNEASKSFFEARQKLDGSKKGVESLVSLRYVNLKALSCRFFGGRLGEDESLGLEPFLQLPAQLAALELDQFSRGTASDLSWSLLACVCLIVCEPEFFRAVVKDSEAADSFIDKLESVLYAHLAALSEISSVEWLNGKHVDSFVLLDVSRYLLQILSVYNSLPNGAHVSDLNFAAVVSHFEKMDEMISSEIKTIYCRNESWLPDTLLAFCLEDLFDSFHKMMSDDSSKEDSFFIDGINTFCTRLYLSRCVFWTLTPEESKDFSQYLFSSLMASRDRDPVEVFVEKLIVYHQNNRRFLDGVVAFEGGEFALKLMSSFPWSFLLSKDRMSGIAVRIYRDLENCDGEIEILERLLGCLESVEDRVVALGRFIGVFVGVMRLNFASLSEADIERFRRECPEKLLALFMTYSGELYQANSDSFKLILEQGGRQDFSFKSCELLKKLFPEAFYFDIGNDPIYGASKGRILSVNGDGDCLLGALIASSSVCGGRDWVGTDPEALRDRLVAETEDLYNGIDSSERAMSSIGMAVHTELADLLQIVFRLEYGEARRLRSSSVSQRAILNFVMAPLKGLIDGVWHLFELDKPGDSTEKLGRLYRFLSDIPNKELVHLRKACEGLQARLNQCDVESDLAGLLFDKLRQVFQLRWENFRARAIISTENGETVSKRAKVSEMALLDAFNLGDIVASAVGEWQSENGGALTPVFFAEQRVGSRFFQKIYNGLEVNERSPDDIVSLMKARLVEKGCPILCHYPGFDVFLKALNSELSVDLSLFKRCFPASYLGGSVVYYLQENHSVGVFVRNGVGKYLWQSQISPIALNFEGGVCISHDGRAHYEGVEIVFGA